MTKKVYTAPSVTDYPFSTDRTWNGLQSVLEDVTGERIRQELLLRAGKFSWTCAEFAPAITDEAKLAVLAEEFGEVARLVTEQVIDRARRNPRELKKELIQVAAVAVAWCEAIDKELEA